MEDEESPSKMKKKPSNKKARSLICQNELKEKNVTQGHVRKLIVSNQEIEDQMENEVGKLIHDITRISANSIL